ncbi:sugar phosphate isomerase/epimerase family protein [Geotalea toluenoxydans]|uniref:sugar phosphate isomerase/epimerase family protein n=1 Tax=Geotalea toluenoxydans TaxID=421624 RepID=UPI0006D2960C|nr:sugar phosphate isomerase/epimerase family protein [Geotalea toluenoxydans]
MRIGAMNHPRHRVEDEILWMVEMGLDFIDLTLEPPGAGHWQVDVESIQELLKETGLGVIGHTAYYLPLGHPFEEVREGAVEAFSSTLQILARLGACCMNIHPDFKAPMHDAAFSVEQNLKSIRELLPLARRLDMELMIENLPDNINDVPQLGRFLEAIPELGLHLDIGHTNLMVKHNTTAGIMERYGHRVRHVHLHDNRGTDDLHLPLGAGTLDLGSCIKSLKAAGYDGTITLEVFTPDRELLRFSADKLRRVWEEVS